MHPDLLPLIGQPYKFENSPRIDLADPEALNCQLAVHQIFRLAEGITLAKGLWSRELFFDTIFFRTVEKGESLFSFDVGLFGPKGAVDPRLLHAASFIDEPGEPQLIHANIVDKQVSVWPLSQFFSQPRYAELKRVKRFHYHPLLYTQKLNYVF